MASKNYKRFEAWLTKTQCAALKKKPRQGSAVIRKALEAMGIK